MLKIALIWAMGSVIANGAADFIIATYLTGVRLDWGCLTCCALGIYKLLLPKKYAAANTYFSVLLSWGLVVICLMCMVGIKVYKKHFGSRGSRL